MPVGDTENAFHQAALDDGIVLARARVPWINQRGHLGLPGKADSAAPILAAIFEALGGIATEQAAKRLTPLRGDFLHRESGVFIEIDESQHFTTARRISLDLYPASAGAGFDIDLYKALCEEWSPRSDKYYASKPARGFGPCGRQRQRAYHDALRDLVTPAMGHPPLIRVAAPERDGAAAYARVRERVLTALA